MKVAFYRGIRPGVAGIYSHGVKIITKSKYSHCEIIFEKDGLSASSSFTDGGVRFKDIAYTSGDWDIVDLPGLDETTAREWFQEHEGLKYDLLGNVHFIFSVVGNEKRKWFCSEACAAALGFPNPWRYDPGTLHSAVVGLSNALHQIQKIPLTYAEKISA